MFNIIYGKSDILYCRDVPAERLYEGWGVFITVNKQKNRLSLILFNFLEYKKLWREFVLFVA